MEKHLGFQLPHQAAKEAPSVLTAAPTLEGFIAQVEEALALRRAGGGGADQEAAVDEAEDLLITLRRMQSLEEALAAFVQSPLGQILLPFEPKREEPPKRKIGFT